MSAQVEPYQDLLMPADPALGADFTFEVPGDERVVIVSAMCELTCAVGGAERGVSLQMFTWTGRRFMVVGTAAKVSAATSQAFSWQSAAGAGVWSVDDAALAGMPRVMLLPMCTARIHVDGMQAGDQLSELALAVERYPPRDTNAMAAAYPVLEALQELNVQGIRDDVATLTAALTENTERVVTLNGSLQRDRISRAMLART